VSSPDRIRDALAKPPSAIDQAFDQLAVAPENGLDLAAAATKDDAAAAVLVGVGGEHAGAAVGGGVSKKTGGWAAVKAWLRWK
jgi:hypothetical protein